MSRETFEITVNWVLIKSKGFYFEIKGNRYEENLVILLLISILFFFHNNFIIKTVQKDWLSIWLSQIVGLFFQATKLFKLGILVWLFKATV